MSIAAALNWFAWVAVAACLAGFLPMLRLLFVRWPSPDPTSVGLVGAARPRPLGESLLKVLWVPLRAFHQRSSRLWTTGYAAYHIAIVLVCIGYAVSSVLILVRWSMGQAIPDFFSGLPSARSTSTANLLALVFGNAEPLASRFLFGAAAPVFRALCLVELPCALVGNACLLWSAFTRRGGALRHDIDDAARGVRLPGRFSVQRMAIRLTILALILMEVAGRTGRVPTIAYYHALLGMGLVAVLPYTYLAHVPWSVLAVLLATRRRRRNAIA